ncbi:MAG: FIST C-terminal domain-containing protein [Planctomycetes bacterium]|nr:FIST C-terminal domain-containing protein [Planctomycetota bacterium]
MKNLLTVLFSAGALLMLTGCGPANTPPSDGPQEPGDAKAVAFSVGWCTSEDPAAAATKAATDAIEGLGCPAKGVIFYEYFPKTIQDAEGKDKEVPDADKDALVLPALREAVGAVPTIGCRARSLVNGGTMLSNTVAVLAIGGESVSCKAVKAELVADRRAVGTKIAEQLADVKDMKLLMALSEMNLSFDTTEGVSVEDFIRGIVDTAGGDVTLFGGNCMPNDYPADKGGVQFLDDETLEGHVVALGIGGPIAIHANHTNEFKSSDETVEVTKADDKWILQLDGKPAADVYREIRGMKPEDEFTSDSQHPIGVIVTEDKVYLRMVLEEDKEKGALRFVAAVPEGTKIKILIGGFDAQAILDAAKEGITESLAQAGDAEPLVALLSNCCARGFRLREFRKASECEIKQAILPVVDAKGGFPIFGFYAWGELGPIAGPFGGLKCMYQQHTFVSAVVTESK